jgi:hypothetical protein
MCERAHLKQLAFDSRDFLAVEKVAAIGIGRQPQHSASKFKVTSRNGLLRIQSSPINIDLPLVA